MIIPLIILSLILLMAAPMIYQEIEEEKKAREREKRQRELYGSSPFASGGTYEPRLMDRPIREAEPPPSNGFSDSEPFSLNPVQPLNPQPEPPHVQFSEPSELPPKNWADAEVNKFFAKKFLEDNAPFHDFSIPDIDITDGQLKTLTRTSIFLSRAYESGVSKTQAYEQILGIHKGGNKAYKRFELIWDEIRNFG